MGHVWRGAKVQLDATHYIEQDEHFSYGRAARVIGRRERVHVKIFKRRTLLADVMAISLNIIRDSKLVVMLKQLLCYGGVREKMSYLNVGAARDGDIQKAQRIFKEYY